MHVKFQPFLMLPFQGLVQFIYTFTNLLDLRQYLGHKKVNFLLRFEALLKYICEDLTWILCGCGDLRKKKG